MNNNNKPVLTKSFLVAYKRKLEKLKDYLGYGEAETPLSESEQQFFLGLSEHEKLMHEIAALKYDLINIKRLEKIFDTDGELNTLLTFDLDYSSQKAVRRPQP